MTFAFRPAMRKVHAWTGVIAGLFISVLGLSGSAIVFRPDIEGVLLPKRSAPVEAERSFRIDDAARQVALARPDAKIERVRLPVEAGSPYIFQVQSPGKLTERIVVDSATGRVLGTLETGWLDWLVDLHHNLLSGKSGRKAVGVGGIFLFGLSATGVWIWFLSARSWRTLITVRREGSSRRFHFELHRVSGMWACAFLLLMSFTGVNLAFPDTFRQAMQSLTGAPPKERAPRVAKSKAKAAVRLDDYLSAAKAAMPDGRPVELRLPEAKGGVEVQMYLAGDLAPAGNHVSLDPGTARVIAIDRAADHPRGARMLAALKPIHYGQVGGVPIRVLWGLGGIVPSLLFVTGLIAWWRPSKRNTTQGGASEARPEEVTVAVS